MNKIFVVFVLVMVFSISPIYAQLPETVVVDQQTVATSIVDMSGSGGGRGFAIPGDVTYGPVLNYFGKGNPSSAMQDVRSFLIYSEVFSEGALEEILSGRKPRSEFKVINRDVDLSKPDQDGVRWIKIVVLTDNQGRMKRYDGAQLIGYSVSESNHRNVTMLEVLAKAALDALRAGCNVLQITAQGSVNDVEARGWGVGLHTTQAQIYDGQERSNVSSGGLGYSSATAGMRDKPWLQAVGLIDYDLQFNRARVKRDK